MSNVLKKITKKYKWLRFLNYKTTKLAVLSAALFGLCLSSGASFAKYRDENYGGGNAGAAKFGGEIVSFDYKTYSIEKISGLLEFRAVSKKICHSGGRLKNVPKRNGTFEKTLGKILNKFQKNGIMKM